MRRIAFISALLIGSLAATPSAPASFILSGDSNNIYGTNGTLAGLPAGNAQFLRNVLGSGTSVQIVRGGGGVDSANVLNALYNSVQGVRSVINTGSITSLSGVNLLFIDLPDTAISTTEASLVRAFESSGGTVFVIGENSTFVNPAAVNSTLGLIGSSLRLIPTLTDGGNPLATIANRQIVADALTAGVDNYLYGGAGISLVSGGKGLILATDRSSALVSIERPSIGSVPEPASLAMLGMGAVGIVLVARRRRAA